MATNTIRIVLAIIPVSMEKYGTDAAFLLNHFVEYRMNVKQGAIPLIFIYTWSTPNLQDLYGDDVKGYSDHYLRCRHRENRNSHYSFIYVSEARVIHKAQFEYKISV